MKTIAKTKLQQIIEHQDDWKYSRQVEPGTLSARTVNNEVE